ncbi:rCG42731, partial [Rattus norvegicus]
MSASLTECSERRRAAQLSMWTSTQQRGYYQAKAGQRPQEDPGEESQV